MKKIMTRGAPLVSPTLTGEGKQIFKKREKVPLSIAPETQVDG